MKTLKQILAESPVPRYNKDITFSDSRSQQIFLSDNFKKSKKLSTYKESSIYYVLTSDGKHVFFVLNDEVSPTGLIVYSEFIKNNESKMVPGLSVSYYWKSPTAPSGIISFIFSYVVKTFGGLLSDHSQTIEANTLWKKFISNTKNIVLYFYLIELVTDIEFKAMEITDRSSASVNTSINSIFKDGSKFYDYRIFASSKKLK